LLVKLNADARQDYLYDDADRLLSIQRLPTAQGNRWETIEDQLRVVEHRTSDDEHQNVGLPAKPASKAPQIPELSSTSTRLSRLIPMSPRHVQRLVPAVHPPAECHGPR
jgi:hypothetical protein